MTTVLIWLEEEVIMEGVYGDRRIIYINVAKMNDKDEKYQTKPVAQ